MPKQCPKEYVDYANETVGSLLGGHNILNPYLGEPFSFCNIDSDIYYFPVYSNGLITHTFRVYLGKDGKPTGVLSPAFASDLNEVASLTSELNPLRIVYETTDEYAAVVFRLAEYEKEVQITPITREVDNDVAVASGNGFTEINKGRPVILNMNGSGAHAIVALGYEDVKATTTAWNPWYTYFETVISLNDYTPAESTGTYYVAEYWYSNYR